VAERFSCAAAARARDEPVYATASHVDRWLCIEQPGAWGADAVAESRIEHDVAVALKARARAIGARLLLIRRHGRYEPEQRTVLVASSRQGDSWVERLLVRDAAQVLDLDLSPFAHHRSVGGERLERPVFLVCTNGRHDACCAEFGRPVAATLSAARPEETWECSHVGGDRFAGNLVCLPEGVYYGNVGPMDGARIAKAHAAGHLDLDHHRGRSTHPFVVQAAEHFLRLQRGITELDAVHPASSHDVGRGQHRVRFRLEGIRDVDVVVHVAPDERPEVLTCRAGRPGSPPRYRLVEILDDPR
jgi:hypothetical protein